MSEPLNFRSAFNGFHREDVVHYIEYLNSNYKAQIRQLQADLAAAQRDNLLQDEEQEQLEKQEAALSALNEEKEALLSKCAQLEAENQRLNAMAAQLEAQLTAEKDAEMQSSWSSFVEEKVAGMEDQFAQQEAVLTALNAEKDELLSRCAGLEASLTALTDENKAITAKAARLEAQLHSASAGNNAGMGAYAEEELAAYRRAERVERMANERAATVYRQLWAALQDTVAKTDLAVANIHALRDTLSDSRAYLDQTICTLDSTFADPEHD